MNKRFFLKNKSYVMALVAFLLLSNKVAGQVTLDYFLNKATENNPELADLHNQVILSQLETQRLERQILWPGISFTADYLFAPFFHNDKIIDTDPGPQAVGYDVNITDGGLYSALINVNQPLWASRRYHAQEFSQKNLQKENQFQRRLARHNLEKKVTDQYIQIYQDQELVQMNNELLSVIDDQVKVITTLAKAGLLKRSDVLLIELELQNEQSEVTLLNSQRKQDLVDLYLLCGTTDTLDVTVQKPNIEIDEIKSPSSPFLDQYLVDSITVLADRQIFETNYVPEVNLFGNAGLNAISLDNIQRKLGISAGISINIPIYDGHQRDINRQKADLSLSTIRNYRDKKQKEVLANLYKYRTAIASTKENLEMLKKQEDTYKSLLKQYQVEIKTGNLSVITYINGIRLYRQLQLNLQEVQKNLMMMKNAYNYWNWTEDE